MGRGGVQRGGRGWLIISHVWLYFVLGYAWLCLVMLVEYLGLCPTRYFQCAPNHGVFSVLGKVELLPANDSTTGASVPKAGRGGCVYGVYLYIYICGGVCMYIYMWWCVCVHVYICVCKWWVGYAWYLWYVLCI